MGFTEKLAAAKAADRPSRTVTVALDGDISAQLSALRAELEAAKKRPADPRLSKKDPAAEITQQIQAIEADYADALVDLKFTRLPGTEWLDITAANMPRPESLPDMMRFGYNFHAVTRAAAVKSGVLVESDGSERVLTDDEWNDLFNLLSGGDSEAIAGAVYALNEGDSDRAVELGKALRESSRGSGSSSGSQSK